MKRRLVFALAAAAGIIAASAGYAFREAIEELVQLHRLESPDAATREAAGRRLVELGSSKAVPVLLRLALAEPDRPRPIAPYGSPPVPSDDPWRALLVQLGSTALPGLLDAYVDGDERCRELTLELVTRLEIALPEAGHAVTCLADPRFEPLHAVLADGVAKLGSRAHPLEKRVLELTRDDSPATRRRAIAILRSIRRGDGRSLIDRLVVLLDDPNEGVRAEAAYSLGHFRAPASVVPALERVAGSPGPGSTAARWAIRRIQETETR